jgi:acyl-coenzyme A synthetase/AMP-(fatty) acid ligase
MTGYGSPLLQLPLPSLRYVTSSGGPLAPTTIDTLCCAHPHVQVYLMYGLTEAFRSTYLDPGQVELRPRSIGKAVPNTQILVLGEDLRPCAPGKVGQLVHRGPTVAAGYWNDPAATATVFRPNPLAPPSVTTETVVFSGDYVTSDADGYLYYVGRRDEMFKSRGIRTSHTEIETELCASGLLSEAAVIALGTDTIEPDLVAFVVPVRPNLDLAELSTYCRAELPNHMQPHHIVPVAALPRTHHGKVDRAAVRSDLALSGRRP